MPEAKNSLVMNGISKARALSQRKREQGLMLLGVELRDAREELFAVMVCDGLSLGIAFRKAGFEAVNHDAPSKMFAVPRIQQRVAAILDERRKQAAITLPDVTGMLQRVYTKAYHNDEMNAAHNAAFSLARLYGHVTDRAVVETIRKPSRDPDAPAERSLTNWIDALPFKGPSSEGPQIPAVEAAPPHSRAVIEKISMLSADNNPVPKVERDTSGTPTPNFSMISMTNDALLGNVSEGTERERASSPAGTGWQSGNEAPTRPVTGTPHSRAQSVPLAVSRETPALIRKRKRKANKVPVLSGAQKRKIKRMKELFG